MSDFKLKGPYETEIRVKVTNGDDQEGEITINLSTAEPPSQEEIDSALKKAEETAAQSGFRLMNKVEFFNSLMREKLGARERFACPGGEAWDV